MNNKLSQNNNNNMNNDFNYFNNSINNKKIYNMNPQQKNPNPINFIK